MSTRIMQDIRWQQRFQNYQLALQQLRHAVQLRTERGLSALEQQGLIQAFEYTHELAWKVLKDFLEYQGYNDIIGSRDTFRKAFGLGIIEDGETWMESITARNRSAHSYNQSAADALAQQISATYLPIFNALEHSLAQRLNNAIKP